MAKVKVSGEIISIEQGVGKVVDTMNVYDSEGNTLEQRLQSAINTNRIANNAVTENKLADNVRNKLNNALISVVTVAEIESGTVDDIYKAIIIGAVGTKAIFLENGAVSVSYKRTSYSAIIFEFTYNGYYYQLNENLEVVFKGETAKTFLSTIPINKFRTREYTHAEVDALYNAVLSDKSIFIIAESNQSAHAHLSKGIIPCVSRLEGFGMSGSTVKVVLECQYGLNNVVIELTPSGNYDCVVTESKSTDIEVDNDTLCYDTNNKLKIKTAGVGVSQIKNDAITTDKINDEAVTNEKVASDAALAGGQLATASSTVKGAVRVGSGLTIDDDGILSAIGGGKSDIVDVKVNNTSVVDTDGVAHINAGPGLEYKENANYFQVKTGDGIAKNANNEVFADIDHGLFVNNDGKIAVRVAQEGRLEFIGQNNDLTVAIDSTQFKTTGALSIKENGITGTEIAEEAINASHIEPYAELSDGQLATAAENVKGAVKVGSGLMMTDETMEVKIDGFTIQIDSDSKEMVVGDDSIDEQHLTPAYNAYIQSLVNRIAALEEELHPKTVAITCLPSATVEASGGEITINISNNFEATAINLEVIGTSYGTLTKVNDTQYKYQFPTHTGTSLRTVTVKATASKGDASVSMMQVLTQKGYVQSFDCWIGSAGDEATAEDYNDSIDRVIQNNAFKQSLTSNSARKNYTIQVGDWEKIVMAFPKSFNITPANFYEGAFQGGVEMTTKVINDIEYNVLYSNAQEPTTHNITIK